MSTDEEYTPSQLRLIEVWDAHVKAEFADANVEETMATMINGETTSVETDGTTTVTVPFVNHVPTMTGGYGRAAIEHFYSDYFLPQMPKDTETKLVSRTVGRSQIVDEMIFSFTHDISMAWMLPGVKPTMKKVQVPLVAIIGFENDKVSFERIYWDQASVLVQIGLIDDATLPVTGVEQTKKVEDPSLPSNTLI
jgi:carboxymethylenebutenolidase